MTLTTRTLRTACIASLALTGLAGSAAAEDREFSWSVNIAGTSDYVFRGISQTDNEPALSGGLDIGYGIFYAGVWASNVDEGFITTDVEVDLYAGIKPVWGKVTFDFAVLYYGYPNQTALVNVDYWEFKAGASMAVTDKLTVGLNYWYTPDYSFETGEGHTVEGNVAYALPQCWVFAPTLSAALGYQTAEVPGAFPADNGGIDTDGDGIGDTSVTDEITYWNVGLALAVDKLTLDFRYWDSSIENDITDERFVFTTKIVLP